MATPATEYLTAMFRELERLWPAPWMTISHSIAWNNETESLMVLFNVGDCVLTYIPQPGDFTDDPQATAANLFAHGKIDLRSPETEHRLITFKR